MDAWSALGSRDSALSQVWWQIRQDIGPGTEPRITAPLGVPLTLRGDIEGASPAKDGVGRGPFGEGLDRAESRADVCQLRFDHVEGETGCEKSPAWMKSVGKPRTSAAPGAPPTARLPKSQAVGHIQSTHPSGKHPSRGTGPPPRETACRTGGDLRRLLPGWVLTADPDRETGTLRDSSLVIHG